MKPRSNNMPKEIVDISKDNSRITAPVNSTPNVILMSYHKPASLHHQHQRKLLHPRHRKHHLLQLKLEVQQNHHHHLQLWTRKEKLHFNPEARLPDQAEPLKCQPNLKTEL